MHDWVSVDKQTFHKHAVRERSEDCDRTALIGEPPPALYSVRVPGAYEQSKVVASIVFRHRFRSKSAGKRPFLPGQVSPHMLDDIVEALSGAIPADDKLGAQPLCVRS